MANDPKQVMRNFSRAMVNAERSIKEVTNLVKQFETTLDAFDRQTGLEFDSNAKYELNNCERELRDLVNAVQRLDSELRDTPRKLSKLKY